MTMVVHTARISSRDPDRFDVTRASGGPAGEPFAPSASLLSAGKSGRMAWEDYARHYTAEMRESYRRNPVAWDGLRTRPRVVLVCFCVDPGLCHRSVLAGILSKLGAEVRGELGLAEAVASARAAIAGTGKLTPRDLVAAVDDAGAELCVVWGVLYRAGVVERSYEEMKLRGLLAAVKTARAERAKMTNEDADA